MAVRSASDSVNAGIPCRRPAGRGRPDRWRRRARRRPRASSASGRCRPRRPRRRARDRSRTATANRVRPASICSREYSCGAFVCRRPHRRRTRLPAPLRRRRGAPGPRRTCASTAAAVTRRQRGEYRSGAETHATTRIRENIADEYHRWSRRRQHECRVYRPERSTEESRDTNRNGTRRRRLRRPASRRRGAAARLRRHRGGGRQHRRLGAAEGGGARRAPRLRQLSGADRRPRRARRPQRDAEPPALRGHVGRARPRASTSSRTSRWR